jgi:hypothetical protein
MKGESQMNDFELTIDILKRGHANFEVFQWRGADCIHVYNDVEEILEFTFDEFGNIVIIE